MNPWYTVIFIISVLALGRYILYYLDHCRHTWVIHQEAVLRQTTTKRVVGKFIINRCTLCGELKEHHFTIPEEYS